MGIFDFILGKGSFQPTHKDASGSGNATFKPWRNEVGEFQGYFRPAISPRRIVLFFHGNGGEALDRSWIDELIPESDLLVLVEYPGYGARPGKAAEAKILEDSIRIVEAARAKWGNCPILAVGENLGATVAAYLASLGKVDRLALISPRLRTVEWVKAAQAPLHVVHGTLDQEVPAEFGRPVPIDGVPGFDDAGLDHALLYSPFTSRFRDFLAN